MNAKRCGYCNMRWSKCLCDAKSTSQKRVPYPGKDTAQESLAIYEHAGSRAAYWRKWLNTEGVRLGLWVHPEQHLSSQDRCQAVLTAADTPMENAGDGQGAEGGFNIQKLIESHSRCVSAGKDDTVS